MSDLLTILIPTLPRRAKFLDQLSVQLATQAFIRLDRGCSVDFNVLIDDTEGISIGAKRNIMMAKVETPYVTFIDDDDRIASNYVDLIITGILKYEPDCCSLNGIITTDGQNPKIFRHSIEYDSMYEKEGIYYRPPNHLNTIRTDIAKQFPFPDWQYSEDSNFCFQLQAGGLLKKEYKIEDTLYYYLYRTDKRILG